MKSKLNTAVDFEMFFYRMKDFACITDLEGCVIKVNQEWENKVGQNNDSYVLFDLLHVNDVALWRNNWDRITTGELDSIQLQGRVRSLSYEHEYISAQWTVDRIDNCLFVTGKEVCHDNSTSDRFEFDLDHNMSQLSAFLEFTSDAVYLSNEYGGFEYVNIKACEMLQYTKDELESMSTQDIDPYFAMDYSESNFFSSIQKKKNCSQVFEAIHRKKNGELLPVEINSVFIWKYNKGYILSFVRDISRRKQKEIDLQKSQKLLRESQAIAKIGNFELNLINKKVKWSDEVFELFGLTKKEKELNFENVLKIIPEAERIKIKDAISRTVKEKRFIDHEHKGVNKNGDYIYLSITGEAVLNKSGEVERVYGVVQDITDRKNYEEDLIKKQRLLLDSHRVAKMGAWEFDINNDEVIWNKEFFEILEVKTEGLKPSLELFASTIHSEDRGKWDKCLEDMFNLKQFSDLELRLLLSDGRMKNILLAGDVVFDEYHNLLRIYGIVQDITERKMYKQQLIDAKNKAEESDRLKSAFLANLSHEIRTPMNAIIGFSSFLKDPEITKDEIQRYSDIIINSGEHLLNLINDIIDISKIDAGQVDIVKTNVNITTIINDVFIFFQSFLDAKNITNVKLFLDIPEVNTYGYTDEMRLKQILYNIIGNAIKFTEKGYVKIRFTKEENLLRFNIEDTGVGIPYEKKDVIYERFQQGYFSTEKVYGGTGLGLAIVKACVELLDGDISFTSKVGEGTNFQIVLKE